MFTTRQILKSTAAAAAAVVSAATLFFAGAGAAMAPEAGRLNNNSPLAASANAWRYATYVESHAPTYGFYLSNYWPSGYLYSSYAGYPCSRVAQPGGATLPGYIVTSGTCPAAPSSDRRDRSAMPRHGLIVVGLVAVLGVGSALAARGFGVRPVQIVSGSMSPTVKGGEWIVVHDLDRTSRAEVKRGDIVLFRYVRGRLRAIKRVVAIGGDRVAIAAHSITVNGKVTRLAGAPGPASARARVETVPPGHVFLLGDNSRVSIDSRAFGAVPVSEIVGRRVVTLGGTRSILLEALAATLLAAAAMIVAGTIRPPRLASQRN